MIGPRSQASKPTTRTRPAPDLQVLPVTVQAQTVAKLRNAILTGVFSPGEKLVEADLCARLGVSRTSVREALRRLEAERLITIVPNRGPSVSEIGWPEAQQIYDVRAVLEAEAAALFARRATAPQLRALASAMAEFETAVRANNALRRLATTERFYRVILEGCGNQVIMELLNGLLARITFLRARSMSRPGRSIESAAEMRKMLKAITSGNARAARTAAIEHVMAAAAAARRSFEQEAQPPVPKAARQVRHEA
jgi:DNA-binding GntR family transcriptional regulator